MSRGFEVVSAGQYGLGVTTVDPILRVAREVFGYESLRPGQREAVESVLAGRDTLAVLATGGGKSAIYALAGQLLAGPTLVISPLIALQRDQLAALTAHRRISAVAVNSASSARQRREALASRPDYLFLAPEQLANADVLHQLAELQPPLVAVDEAHLVSQWGPDFRPDYLRIGRAVEAIGRPVILGLTATAAPPVREEIIERLGMRDPSVMIRGFARANIDLAVHGYFTDEAHKLSVIVDDVVEAARHQGHGIVYGATHKRVESLAAELTDRGLRAAPYHAGLQASQRLEVEKGFRAGQFDVVVATVAFGMGVDKPDIRWVVHADVSGSLDEYYQEIGRAGRDGKPADAVLYYRPEDLRLPRMYASRAGPGEASLNAVVAALTSDQPAIDLTDVSNKTKLSREGAGAAAMTLADVGAVTVAADGRITVTGDLSEAVPRALDLVARRRSIERSRIETMAGFGEYLQCRWKFLLEYFGEPAPDHCGHCDNDHRAEANRDDRHGQRPFPRGSRVRHRLFGEGEVVGYAGSRILLAFDTVGYRRLDVGLVLERNLLEMVEVGR
jgi:ATP-dependent DNA helicase RecQ